jgi:hypothetical protein
MRLFQLKFPLPGPDRPSCPRKRAHTLVPTGPNACMPARASCHVETLSTSASDVQAASYLGDIQTSTSTCRAMVELMLQEEAFLLKECGCPEAIALVNRITASAQSTRHAIARMLLRAARITGSGVCELAIMLRHMPDELTAMLLEASMTPTLVPGVTEARRAVIGPSADVTHQSKLPSPSIQACPASAAGPPTQRASGCDSRSTLWTLHLEAALVTEPAVARRCATVARTSLPRAHAISLSDSICCASGVPGGVWEHCMDLPAAGLPGIHGQLRELRVSGLKLCCCFATWIAEPLAALTGLRALRFTRCDLRSDSLVALRLSDCRYRRQLTALELTGNLQLFENAGVNQEVHDTAVQNFAMFVGWLRKMPALQELNLSATGIPAGAEAALGGALACLRALSHLDVSTNFALRGSWLRAAVAGCGAPLRHLSLARTWLVDEETGRHGVVSLRPCDLHASLQHCLQLRDLDISECTSWGAVCGGTEGEPASGLCWTTPGLAPLTHLSVLTQLTRFACRGVALGDAAVAELARVALPGMAHLQALELAGTGCGDAGVGALLAALPALRALRTLGLEGNAVSAGALSTLERAVRASAPLTLRPPSASGPRVAAKCSVTWSAAMME